MKKIFAFILAAVLAVSVVGCGGDKNKKTSQNNDVSTENGANAGGENDENTPDVSDPNGENTQTPDSGTSNTDNTQNDTQGTDSNDNNESSDTQSSDNPSTDTGTQNGDKKPADESTKTESSDNPSADSGNESTVVLPSVSKQTPVDTDVCKFTVTGIKEDSFIGPTLLCELENKSKDVNYMFSIKDSYVNGVYTPMYLYSEVAAGKKMNVEVSLSTDEMRKYGLTKITDIEITLEVKDSSASWIDPPAVLETFNIQPYGKGQVKKFNIGNDVVKNVYIDNKYAKVSALNYYFNDMYGYCIDLFIENKSDANISVKFENTSVNKKLLDPYVYEVVNKGKSVIARVDWPVSDFEEHGFTTFEEIKFTLVIANNDDVAGKSYSSDEIVLSFGG